MSKTYQNITYEERCQISGLLKAGHSTGVIAEILGRNRSTIYREIRRNSEEGGYLHNHADEKAKARRDAAGSLTTKRFTPEIRAKVEARLKEGWTPEQISKRQCLEGQPIGRQRIYDHVYAAQKDGIDLIQYLHRSTRNPNYKRKSHAGRGIGGS